MIRPFPIVICLLSALSWTSAIASAAQPAPAQPIDFTRDVQPILAAHCLDCHGPEKQKGGLRLDVKADAFKNLDSGQPAIVAGKPAASVLITLLRGNEDGETMPPKGKGKPLTEAQIQTLTRWVEQGATWPDSASAQAGVKSDHWAYQPLAPGALPQVKQKDWPRGAMDFYVLARLEAAGLSPSREADRYTLIKRLSYDLLGLPPTPAETDAFVKSDDADEYEKLVDRLLASPRFGERWGRHWLDKARYADSDGYEKDNNRPDAWRYRDWVIDSINRDQPFDEFTLEQLAGDLLPQASPMQKLATAFHRQTLTNTEGGTDQEQFRVEATFDRTETTASVWLGLTLTCARCHTHKYDTITQREYYEFYAFFNSGDEANAQVPLSDDARAEHQVKLAEHQKKIEAVQKQFDEAAAGLEQAAREWEAQATLAMAGVPDIKFHEVEGVTVAGPEGITFKKLDDGSYLATGANPEKATYTLALQTAMRDVTGVRLEVLPDDSLGGKGPGRTAHGNFVLNELRLFAGEKEKLAKKDQVTIAQTAADFSQDGWPVAGTIDGKEGEGKSGTGWAVGPQFGKAHHADFLFATPLPWREKTFIRIELSQQYGSQHTLGRFRIRLRTGMDLDQVAPKPVRAILAVKPAQRTAQQRKALLDHVASIDPSTKALAAQLAELKKQMPGEPVMSVRVIAQRSSPRKTQILRRGEFLDPFDEVQPDTLEVLLKVHPLKAREGGKMADRLDLARWLMDAKNPLTPRVAVNHIWQHLFGDGLVRTLNDFGVRGDAPTHPKLLDWLAAEYIRLGWSRKALIKTIVMSATYRQASHHRPELAGVDPTNLLLHRQNRFRVEGEIVRDLYLAAAGLLSDKVGGPSVFPPMPADVASLSYANNFKWNESKGEDRFRRGMYTFFKRTSPHPNLINFDCPDSNTTRVKRDVSNTALQPLQTLNNITFVEASQAMTRRVLAQVKGDDTARLTRAIRLCVARMPSSLELERYMDLLAASRRYYSGRSDEAKKLAGDYAPKDVPVEEAAAWTATLRIVMNADEFLTRE